MGGSSGFSGGGGGGWGGPGSGMAQNNAGNFAGYGGSYSGFGGTDSFGGGIGLGGIGFNGSGIGTGGFSSHGQNGMGFGGGGDFSGGAAGAGAAGGFGGGGYGSGGGQSGGFGGAGGGSPGGAGGGGTGGTGGGGTGGAGTGGGGAPGGGNSGGFGGGGGGGPAGPSGGGGAGIDRGRTVQGLPSWFTTDMARQPQFPGANNLNQVVNSLYEWAPDSRLAQRLHDRGPRALARRLGDQTFAEGLPGIMDRVLNQQAKSEAGLGHLEKRKSLAGIYNALSPRNAARKAEIPGTAAFNANAMAQALGLGITPGDVRIPKNIRRMDQFRSGYVTPGWTGRDATRFGGRTFDPSPSDRGSSPLGLAIRFARNAGDRGR